MAGSINKVILVGRLGHDPKIKETKDGKRAAELSIATGESWKDKQTGERREKTEWHNVVVFNEALVNLIEQYVRKGHRVYIEGELQTYKYTDKNGIDRKSTNIVLQAYRGVLTMLESKGSGNSAIDNCYDNTNPPPQASAQQYANASQGGYDADAVF